MISVIIVPAKCSTAASACNNPSDNITEIRYFWTVRLLRPKQNKVLYVNMEYMDLLPPTAPASFSRARLAGPIDMEINNRIQAASGAFGGLLKRVWSQHGMTVSTKCNMYEAIVLPTHST